MTTGKAPMCLTCKHFKKAYGLPCDAFPNGIPDDILGSKVLHTSPYPGDQGIQYEAVASKANTTLLHGGPGSGNFGHAGRPGEVGGSSSGSGSSAGSKGGRIKALKEKAFKKMGIKPKQENPNAHATFDEKLGGHRTGKFYKRDDLPAEQLRAIELYQGLGGGYSFSVNTALRNDTYDPMKVNSLLFQQSVGRNFVHDDLTEEFLRQEVANLDEAANASKLGEDIVLHRGLDAHFVPQGSYKVGDIIVDKGFQSSSTDEDHAGFFADTREEGPPGDKQDTSFALRILGEKGDKCIYMGERENEYVWPRNAAFEVLSVSERPTSYGKHQVISVRFVGEKEAAA